MKINELSDKLQAVGAQLEKAKAEITAQIDALKAALENVDVPPAAQAALDSLTATAQALDDINPDTPPAP